jgi:calcium-dependent protein kinase
LLAHPCANCILHALRQAFEDLDADGNGVISISELQSLMEKEGLSNIEAEVKHLLQGIDIDGSNTLDYREFLAATMERNLFIQEDNIKKA